MSNFKINFRGVPDYVQTTVDTILRLHREEPSGDILAFLTGQDEVEQACKLLEGSIKSLPKDLDKLLILPLYGGLDFFKIFFIWS